MAVEQTTTYNKYAHLDPDNNGEDVGGMMGRGGPPPEFSVGKGGPPPSDYGRGAPPDTTSRRGGMQQEGVGRGLSNHKFGGGSSYPPPPPQGTGVFYVTGEDMDRSVVNEQGFTNHTQDKPYTEKELEYFFTPVDVPPSEHKLQSQYCLWYSTRGYGKQSHDFNQNLKPIGKFGSVEQFWSLYAHLVRPGELTNCPDVHLRRQVSSFHIFKMGIKPMWEDPANLNGGKWMFKLRKGLSSRCWENLVMAMLGEQFMVGDQICGAVISVRIQDDLISVWNRSAHDTAVTTRIRDTFRRVLNLPPHTAIEYEYRVHAEYLQKHQGKSFRNTEEKPVS